MDKITVPIRSISGDFKVGEEVTGSVSNTTGKLEEFDDQKLVITISSGKSFQDNEKITGKESEAKAVVGEKENLAERTVVVELSGVEGKFKEGEKVKGKDSKITGTVRKSEPEKIAVFLTVEGNFKEGEEITGADSKAKAEVGKKPSPYKYPKPPAKDAEDLKQLQEQLQEQLDLLTEKLTERDTEISELKSRSHTQEEKIEQVEKERSSEKRTAHLKDVQNWCEDLKRKGLAPAVVDELGLINYANALDWQNTIKFAEGEDSITPWKKFSELVDSLVDCGKDGKLIVPLDELGVVVETEDVIPEGIDAEGAKLDAEITKYAEEQKVSYAEAFKVVIEEKAKNK